jgi:hypothetical protein
MEEGHIISEIIQNFFFWVQIVFWQFGQIKKSDTDISVIWTMAEIFMKLKFGTTQRIMFVGQSSLSRGLGGPKFFSLPEDTLSTAPINPALQDRLLRLLMLVSSPPQTPWRLSRALPRYVSAFSSSQSTWPLKSSIRVFFRV